jgi:hypothetical protein
MQPIYRWTEKGKHRLHERLYFFNISVASIAIAATYLESGKADFKPGQNIELAGDHLNLSVRFPLHGPVQGALKGLTPDKVQYTITAKSQQRLDQYAAEIQSGQKPHVAPIITPVFMNLISPVFVDYFEAYKEWLYRKLNNPDNWPSAWRFGWMVRNAMSHNGMVHFLKKGPPVSWHGLTYSYDDNDKVKIVGNVLSTGDIVILMFDMDDELNTLGCPLIVP